MRIALITLKLEPNEPQSHLKGMARWIERLHDDHDILLFPRIELQPDSDILQTVDVIGAMASKRRVRVATVLNMPLRDKKQQTVLLAETSGQVDVRNHVISRDDATPHAATPLVTTGIEGFRLGLTNQESLSATTLKADVELARLDMLCVPLHFAGTDDEAGRIAKHNPPALLTELTDTLADIAREMRLRLVVVNGFGDDNDCKCGPCGGAWVYGPDGMRLCDIEILKQDSVTYVMNGAEQKDE